MFGQNTDGSVSLVYVTDRAEFICLPPQNAKASLPKILGREAKLFISLLRRLDSRFKASESYLDSTKVAYLVNFQLSVELALGFEY